MDDGHQGDLADIADVFVDDKLEICYVDQSEVAIIQTRQVMVFLILMIIYIL